MRAFFNYVFSTLAIGLLLITMISAGGCSFSSEKGEKLDSLYRVTANSSIEYLLHSPNERYVLPYELSEVSGLSFVAPATLLMIEDERGVLFQYDIEDKKVRSETRFADQGDYEGVQLVGEEVFVLKSDGKIYRFPLSEDAEVESEELETELDSDNDVEGLGYDPDRKLLLLACKEDGGIGDEDVEGRAIYGYDLRENRFIEEPLFSVSDNDLIDFFRKHKGADYEKERIKFHPSAIAFHPIEKRYYILASTGKLLVVTEPDGSIVTTYPILSDILNQPEGIGFAPGGDMYISSEGEGGDGFVLRYRMIERDPQKD